jgi:putative transposase
MRYIELNPVRANNMAGHPAEYPWFSYGCNALGKEDPLVTPHREYKRLGATAEERQTAYRQLFRVRIPEMSLQALREATNKAWVLGSDRFKRKIEKAVHRPVASKGHGGDRKSENYRTKFGTRVEKVRGWKTVTFYEYCCHSLSLPPPCERGAYVNIPLSRLIFKC